MPRNRVDGMIGVNEKIKHPPTRRMTDRPKNLLLAIRDSDHRINIRKK
jgi:hypothetical protein